MTPDPVVEVKVERSWATPKVKVDLRTYSFKGPFFENALYEKDNCFIDFSLSSRVGIPKGRYDGRWQKSRSETIGSILFVPAGMTLRAGCGAGRQRSLTCNLDASLFRMTGAWLDDDALVETLDVHSRTVRQTLLRILGEATDPSFASPLAIEAAATLLAIDLTRHFAAPTARFTKRRGGLSPTQMRILEDRIHAALPLPTVAELAALCGISERHLARAFRQETGRTVAEYAKAAGIQRAWSLLADGELSVKQVAALLGFADGPSFSYAFRNATGSRPRDVRDLSRRRGGLATTA